MSSFDWELGKLTKKKQCSNEAEEQLHKHITNGLGGGGNEKSREKEEKKEMTVHF